MNNKENVYQYVQNVLLNRIDPNIGIETTEIALALNMQRTNVSALLNKLVQEGLLNKTKTRPVKYFLAPQKNNDPFLALIGNHGSLKKAIQDTKAAILYPKGSLNINISANRGCGSSTFVQCIINFAKKHQIIAEGAPVITINCHNYLNDPETLNELLFGHNYRIFSQNQNGILFFNHLEYLNNQQKTRFSNFLDTHLKDDYIRNIFIIVSSTPEVSENLQQFFPVNLTLPDLKQRPLNEKHALIMDFFNQEARKAGCELIVEIDVIKALLLCDFSGNIQELKRQITLACANAHLRIVDTNDPVLHIYSSDLNGQTRLGILNSKQNYELLQNLFDDQERITFEGTELTSDPIERTDKNKRELSKLINPLIINMIENWLDSTSKNLGRLFSPDIFYNLCLHVNSLVELHFNNQRISKTKSLEIINNYPLEYQEVLKLKKMIETQFSLVISKSEVAILLLFLIKPDNQEKIQNHPVLLYAMHGKGTAKALAQTTNALNPGQQAYYFDLDLDQDNKIAYQKLKKHLLSIDQGAGIIIIYDMGSFKVMLDRIAEETQLKIRLFKVPITLLGIEIAHKAQNESDIDYVYHDISVNLKHLFLDNSGKENLIITLCHTGEGGAVQLKNYIEEYSHLNYLVKAMNISHREHLIDEVTQLRQVYNIRAFIGTYNPHLFDIPFISIQKIFSVPHKNLDKVLTFQPLTTNSLIYERIYQYFSEEFKFASIAKIKDVLPEIIDELTIQYHLNRDQKLGLFTHLGSLIERILSGKTQSSNENNQKIIRQFPEDYSYISKLMKSIERKFNIIISDDEIAIIIKTVKKI
ncbi:PRD domain-containing protein [Xylocopilactobacillus apicola]|uniref:LuxR family transcriptional regulator n=1 Tax=Xylocopilactobacillus apicola TaxID=2932184 RepID=A0AAU9D813_9LACO|nr:PRD domain-containing protein [Xylocopilactobacillus apicola]BDR57595.1 LuxR family transcriptional regulator [Xylocopilactobacillus apicola]